MYWLLRFCQLPSFSFITFMFLCCVCRCATCYYDTSNGLERLICEMTSCYYILTTSCVLRRYDSAIRCNNKTLPISVPFPVFTEGYCVTVCHLRRPYCLCGYCDSILVVHDVCKWYIFCCVHYVFIY